MSKSVTRSRNTNYVAENTPSTSYWETTGYMRLQKGTSGNQAYGYAWFSLPFRRGVSILSAKLRVRTRGMNGYTGRQITVRGMGNSFNFTKGTWKSRPAEVWVGQPVTITDGGAKPENYVWEFDVTTIMQQVSDGAYWGGFRLETNDTGPVYVQNHRMGEALAPELEITWSDAPNAPTDLSPAAGRVVGVPRPVLRWGSFEDLSGDTTMAGLQVQLSNWSNFSAVSWDSGSVDSTVSQYDLSKSSAPILAPGGGTWWRVRVRDGAGVWSAWSTPALYNYRPNVTVALTTPSGSGTVGDPTPPFAWTVTDGIQKAFLVNVSMLVNEKWKFLYSSGKVAGSDTSWTADKLLGPNGTYRVTVCVWDEYEREANPLDPGYGVAEKQFTYTYSSTVTTPTAASATPQDPYPGVVLEWTAANAPDRWVILRNGQPLAQYPGPSLLKSGTRYTITDRYPPGRQSHTWQIIAVVNGVSSRPLEVSAIPRPLGTWIGEVNGWRQLCIVQDRDRDVSFGETSNAFTVVDSMAAVVITSSMRGYEGTLKGRLRSIPQIPGKSAADWKKIALDIKSDVGTTYWVMFGDESFRATLTDLNVVRSSSQIGAYEFSVKFYQQRDFNYQG